MAVAHKNFGTKKLKPTGKHPRRLRKQVKEKAFDPVADAEECRRISEALDADAILSFHKKHPPSQKQWETPA